MADSIGIIGAGIVGVTTALELRARGFDVLLVDRHIPGRETSFGNAGVMSGSTVLTVNNPGIWRQLPRLLTNRSPYFSYDAGFVCANWRWLLAFFRYSNPKYVRAKARALRELQRVSLEKHRDLFRRIDARGFLQSDAWLKIFRSKRGFDGTARERSLMEELGIPFSILSNTEVRALEPALMAPIDCGLLAHESHTVRNPYELLTSYMNLYDQGGGQWRAGEVTGIRHDRGWSIELSGKGSVEVGQLVIAAGPWSGDLCRTLGYRVPMAWERGYHAHLEAPKPGLVRSIHDVDLGFVMSPQPSSVRITTGVEFAHRDAPPDYSLIRRAVRGARTAAEFGRELDARPWMGSRPTLPDSLPMIGEATRHKGLWFNFGHQHIGLSTSTGSAALIADKIEHKAPALIDGHPFRPGRFPM